MQDLLPLYIDGVCSGSSKKLIEKHINECGDCMKIKEILEDKSIETSVSDEKKGILARHAAKERSAAWKAGAVIAGILMIPIVIVAIVTAAGKTSAGTLPVLIASMGLVAAVTVLPLMTKKNRFAKAVITSTAAIILIEFFVCRFFDGGSFVKTAVPTVFGISVAFAPFIIRKASLPGALSDKKPLIVLGWDTIWLYLTILAVNTGKGPAVLNEGIIVTTIALIVPWAIFGVTGLPKKVFGKTGISGFIVIICGLWISFAEKLTRMLFGYKYELIHWTMNEALDMKITHDILLVSLIAGAGLIAAGCIKSKNQYK